jgi:hypothetical protein
MTKYGEAFNLVSEVLEFTSPGYKPLLIFFTDGCSSDNESIYMPKIDEIIKKNMNMPFLGIGFGEDFYQNSDCWNALKNISDKIN